MVGGVPILARLLLSYLYMGVHSSQADLDGIDLFCVDQRLSCLRTASGTDRSWPDYLWCLSSNSWPGCPTWLFIQYIARTSYHIVWPHHLILYLVSWNIQRWKFTRDVTYGHKMHLWFMLYVSKMIVDLCRTRILKRESTVKFMPVGNGSCKITFALEHPTARWSDRAFISCERERSNFSTKAT